MSGMCTGPRVSASARHRRSVDGVRVTSVELELLFEAAVGERVEEAVFHQPEPAVVDSAQKGHRLHHLVQHRLETLGPCKGAEHTADCPLLLGCRFELALEIGYISHWRSSVWRAA